MEGDEVLHLWDPSHLIKGIRNNCLKKFLIIGPNNEGVPIWDIITRAWHMNQALNPAKPRLKKITAEHIEENKIHKMRVKHAVQILRKTMSDWILELS